MKFINYCVIIMGKTQGCKTEIVKIAEDTPRFLEAKGVTIATFMSVAEPGEITEYFKTFKRNFLVFNLDKNVSGFNLTDKNIQELLFGHLEESEKEDMKDKFENRTNKLIDEINSKSSFTKKKSPRLEKIVRKIKGEYEISDDMTKKEMTKIINKILDKGPDNFTDYDKKTLLDLSHRTAQLK